VKELSLQSDILWESVCNFPLHCTQLYHLSVDYNYHRCLGAVSEVHVGLNINVVAVQ